jgi:hypothetical protein
MPSRKGPLSGRHAGGRPDSRQRIPPALAVVTLLLLGSLVVLTSGGVAQAASPSSLTPVGSLSDNQQISLVVGGVTHLLTDSVITGSLTPAVRSYEIVLIANLPLPVDEVTLTTNPITQWAGPNQIPDGPDNLPALSNWTWKVLHGETVDSSDWAEDLSAGSLTSTVPWENATFTVVGTPNVQIAVQVNPGLANGPVAPEPGIVMSDQIPLNNPDFTSYAQALDPGLVRWSQTYDAPATWHSSTGTVTFDFSAFGALMNFSKSVGAQVYLSLPAGSWGDGNLLPAGMPLNTSFLVNWWGHGTGYYPSLSAYRTYLTTFVKDVESHGWSIAYWNIGNEVPVGVDKNTAANFVTVFNSAAADIHSILPNALVGSDVFTWPTKEKYFAGVVKGLGFLSFHEYPATKLCANPNTFCLPDNVGGYLTDSKVISTSNNFAEMPWSSAPVPSQDLWHNVTGNWVPMIDSETNLNSAQTPAHDQRQPTLIDGAWIVSQMIDGAAQNLSSVLFYSYGEPWPPPSSPTEKYGGWGAGMTAQESSGADLRFAPYWALDLWASAVPRGARELAVTDTNSPVVRAFAARSGADVSVIVSNRVGVDVTIPISSSNSSWVAVGATTLDQTTYKMVFNESTQTEELLSSGLGYPTPTGTSSMSLTLEGYGVGVVTFARVSPVDHTANFTESGLPAGTDWWVTLGGTTHSSTSSKIAFSEPIGSYSYSVPTIPGYDAVPSSGTVSLFTGNQNVAITFSSPATRYNVSFVESGLAAGTNWSAVLGSTDRFSTGPTISFAMKNGSYEYSVAPVPGFNPVPSSGSVTVQGSALDVPIAFVPLPPGVYPVTFAETGLVFGQSWSVTLDNYNQSSTTREIAFTEVNGSYPYTISPVPGFSALVSSGVAVVSGADVSVQVTFLGLGLADYPVVFSETGLTTGTIWSVTVGSRTQISQTTTDAFREGNGSYDYSTGTVDGYSLSPASGSFNVSGSEVDIDLAYIISPAGNLSGGPAAGGVGGVGRTIFNWISLGVLGPSVGKSGLLLIQVGYVSVLLGAMVALVVRWRRPGPPTSATASARTVRVSATTRKGYRPPPDVSSATGPYNR